MRFALLLFLFFGFSSIYAQVKFESEQDQDGNIIIYGINSDVIPYTVVLDFSTLTNFSSSGRTVFAVASTGKSVLTKLKKLNANQSTSFNYSSKVYKGSYLNKSKEDIAYLIPVQEGVKVRMTLLTHIENVYKKDSENKNYVGTAFNFDEPTIICAPRKGIISDMKMNLQVTGGNLSFNASDNYIEIYHEDGIFTRLLVLEAGSEKVKIGDTVYPGQPIAASSGEKYGSGRHVRMIQSRLIKNDRELKMEVLPVKIFDGEKEVSSNELISEMTVVHPEYLKTKEMNKKELKRINFQ